MVNKKLTYPESDLIDVDCDLCGSNASILLFEKDGFKYVKCRHCDLVHVNPRLRNPFEHQETFYNNLAASFGDLGERAHHDYTGSRRKRFLKEAATYLPYNLNGRILDVGCGLGGFLKGAAEQGWKYPEGIEIAPQAAEYTSKFFPVRTKPFEETQYDYYFDVIRLENVIEHVPSPRSIAALAYKYLRPGGLFVISTPNYRSLSVRLCREKWQYICGADHIYLFSPKTISQLLGKNGFKILSLRTKGIHLTPKNHAKKPPSYNEIKFIEKVLDLFMRRTRWGHRLKVLAEKI